jgi:hypothetical protein
MRSGIGTWPLCLALAAVGCDEGGGVTEPPTPTPQATPLGTFAIVSASPAFGGTVIDPATNQLRTLFTQDASGGWTFAFAC